MASVRIGINGLGRIGRTVLRHAVQRALDRDWSGVTRPRMGLGEGPGPSLEIVAANDLLPIEKLAYLIEYDSVHRGFRPEVKIDGRRLRVGPHTLEVHAERDPAKIPWSQDGVDVVFECTGAFGRRRELERHLSHAPKVILGAPGEADAMVVLGVNEEALDADHHRLISAASCTTHAIAPVLAVLDRTFGVRWAIIGTIHAYTAGQVLIDGASPSSDLRRGRAAAINIVPTTTHAARALTQVLPRLAGKLTGAAVRVPVPDGSMWDLTCTLAESHELPEVIDALREGAASGPMQGILSVTEAPLVSSDILGTTYSSILDVGACHASGPLLKLQGWYDNETGYAARLLDLAAIVGGRGGEARA